MNVAVHALMTLILGRATDSDGGDHTLPITGRLRDDGFPERRSLLFRMARTGTGQRARHTNCVWTDENVIEINGNCAICESQRRVDHLLSYSAITYEREPCP